MPRVLPAILMAAAAAFPAHAADWAQVATISSTLGVNANRLCLGEGARSDIGCPTYAPSITTAGHVSVTGNLSAAAFIGDGSGLIGIGQGDRITSGTTSVIATQDRSVTISTAGTQRVVVGENGNVGIGTTSPSQILDVSGWTKTTGLIWATGSSLGSAGQISAQSTGTFSNNRVTIGAGLTTGTDGAVYSLSGKSLELAADATAGRGLLIKSGTGNVGIGTTSPQTTLQVSGSLTVSTSAQTTTPSLYVNTSGNVGIGTSSPWARLHVASTGTAMEVGDGTGTATYIGLAGTRVKFGFNGNGADVNGLTKAVTLTNNSGVGLAYTATGNSIGLGGQIGDAASLLGAKMVVLGTGNVGIATTAPSATVHVSGTARITSWTAIAANVTPTTELDVYGTISATNILVNGAPITATADRITSGTTNIIANTNGPISFTTAGTERMVINSSGNVGIGLAAPATSFHVSGTARFEGVSGVQVGTTGNMAIMLGGDRNLYNLGGVVRSGSGAGLSLQTNAANITYLHIPANGNVGIGTTSPGKTLSVSGTAEFVSRTLIGGTGTPSATLQVSGSLLLAGNDNIPCTDSVLGLVRRNPSTGRLQACR